MKSRILALLSLLALLTACSSQSEPDCTAFNKTFDDLQVKQAQSAAAIANRGICHTRVESERRAKCPEYYQWIAAATNFANFVATDKSGCTDDSDRKNALADLAELAKEGAFPQQ